MQREDEMTDKEMRIERFPGYRFYKDGTVVSYLHKTPRALRPIRMGNYTGLHLRRRDGTREKQYLHRLICEAAHGPCPKGMECRHLNGIRTDNRAENLAWGTPQENERDRIRHGTVLHGERNPMSVLTSDAVRKMRRERAATGDSYKVIASRFGVSAMAAYRAISRQSWRNIK